MNQNGTHATYKKLLEACVKIECAAAAETIVQVLNGSINTYIAVIGHSLTNIPCTEPEDTLPTEPVSSTDTTRIVEQASSPTAGTDVSSTDQASSQVTGVITSTEQAHSSSQLSKV